MPNTIKKNIILLGDGAVGKTSLIRRYVIDEFSDDYITTIGTKVTKKDIYLGEDEEETLLTMMMWDIIGQKGFRYTQSLSARGMSGALLVSDLTRKETLESLKSYWIPLVIRIAGPIPMIFLGNKADLEDELQFGLEDIVSVAAECEAFGSTNECFLTSAKTGNNVEKTFFKMAEYTRITRVEPKFNYSWNLMDKEEIGSLRDVVDHIIADFSDQFGGIEHATPFIKQQMNIAELDIKKPTEVAVVRFIDNLMNIEMTYKTELVAKKNRLNRLRLFGYKQR